VLGVSRDLFPTPIIELDGLPSRGRLTDAGVGSVIDLGDICETPVEPFFSPEAFGGAIRRIDQSGGLGLGGVLTSVAQIPREVRRLQEQITRTVALRAKLTLDKLGPVPTDDLQLNFVGDASLSKLLRNGLAVEVGFETQSREHSFIDKPLDPAYGGLGLPDQFYSQFGGRLNVPLGRGRGATATAGAERAAGYIAQAERDELRHRVAEEVFRTVVSYLNLVAAQETIDVLEQSGARHQQIFTLTQQRVTGGDLAGIELSRVQARQARVAVSTAQARVAWQEARLALADAMGIPVTSIEEAPLAGNSLAITVAALPDVSTLLASARQERLDARAARERREASTLLAAAAQANARPRFDMTVEVGMSNFYDSPFFRYLEDGPNAILETRSVPIDVLTGAPGPKLSPVRYYDPRGFYRAVTGRYEPFAAITFNWELPFGNNSARGRAAQAAATLESSSIQVTDLHRVIDERLLSVAEVVRRNAAATAEAERAVTAGGQLLDSALQLLQAGDLTIIDTLLTEEGVTGDQLQLVRRRQAYLSALARLRFEAASLVRVEDSGTGVERFGFEPGVFVGN
jgi:outer membrane protein TolC